MEDKLKELAQQIIHAQEEERQRIAREIHDELGQSLIALKLFISSGLSETCARQPEIAGFCESLKRQINNIIDKVRDISHDLRPRTLQVLGLSMAIKVMVEKVESESGLKIRYRGLDLKGFLFKGGGINVYRIIQEALTNIMEHAQATEVGINMRARDRELRITVEDNGRGIPEPERKSRRSRARHLGLSIMNERAKLLGGDLRIESGEKKGTKIILRIPFRKAGK